MKCRREFHRRNVQSDSGFTLLELLTVIAIIGILAGILLPAIGRIRERARIGAAKAQLSHIETALTQYYSEWDTYPPMGNDWVAGGFFYSEDVGTDGAGPFTKSGGVNGSYSGPDSNGTEGNYRLDAGEDTGLTTDPNDPTKNNGRLDGTYYDRLRIISDMDKVALIDLFTKDSYYHYYAGYVTGKTDLGMPEYPYWDDTNATTGALDEYKADPPPYYNRWVIYSVGLDGKDHALHNYYLTMQDGEDVGTDGFASDPADQDGDFILFEPSDEDIDGIPEENNADPGDAGEAFVQVTIVETGWQTTVGMTEQQFPARNNTKLEGPEGMPVFSYDVRRNRKGKLYVMPDGDPVASYGMIMRYGP